MIANIINHLPYICAGALAAIVFFCMMGAIASCMLSSKISQEEERRRNDSTYRI